MHASGSIEGEDAWSLLHAGARYDLAPTDRDEWSLSGEAYRGQVHNQYTVAQPTPPFVFTGREQNDVSGAGLRTRWTRTLSSTSSFTLQAFLDQYSRALELFEEDRTTADVDFQHSFQLSPSQQLMWGAATRASYTDTKDTFLIAWRDNHRLDLLASAFVQDEITLAPDRWKLTLGTKVEHADSVGANLQPSLRLLYTPNDHESWWASVSRAVRTPSQAEQDVTVLQGFVPGVPNQVFLLEGDRDVDPETMDAVELGYRTRPHERVSIDLAAFYNHYRDLIQYEPQTPFLSGADLIIPLIAQNVPSADAYGFELAAEWAPAENTRVTGSWSRQHITVDGGGSSSPTVSEPEGITPENQYDLRVQHDFTSELQADAMVFYVDRLPQGDIDHYWRLDLRLEYRPDDRRSFAIGVQNLLHDGEKEFDTATFNASNEMDLAVYFKAVWSF
ncbi:MAG: TonB-dependent receptor [Planctomycetes bacterium]|nr:TonB-dependent receptor [Planctomycetota bacterium]